MQTNYFQWKQISKVEDFIFATMRSAHVGCCWWREKSRDEWANICRITMTFVPSSHSAGKRKRTRCKNAHKMHIFAIFSSAFRQCSLSTWNIYHFGLFRLGKNSIGEDGNSVGVCFFFHRTTAAHSNWRCANQKCLVVPRSVCWVNLFDFSWNVAC